MSAVLLRMARVEYGWLNLFTFNSVIQSSNIIFFSFWHLYCSVMVGSYENLK